MYVQYIIYAKANKINQHFLNGSYLLRFKPVFIKEEKEERVFTIEYIEKEIDEATRKSTKPEDIQACLHAGILPECYEGISVSVEFQKDDDSVLSNCHRCQRE